jgi:hypothetical protein
MQRTVTPSTASVRGDRDAATADLTAAAVSECRALAVVTPASSEKGEIVRCYRSATFLAQLLAAKAQLPQSRERRRAEPDVVMHVYEAGMTPQPLAQGRLFSRAM